MAETSEVLKARDVSATIYGGGGVATGTVDVSRLGGAIARVRVGVGQRQEVGVEGGNYYSGRPGSGSVWGVGKLTWKMALPRSTAVVTGAGVTFVGGSVGLGADAAVVTSTNAFGRRDVAVYTGLRGTIVFPASTDPLRDGGVTAGGVWPIGLAFSSGNWRAFVESGLIAGGSVNHAPFNAPNAREYNGWFGAYGAVAISGAWRR